MLFGETTLTRYLIRKVFEDLLLSATEASSRQSCLTLILILVYDILRPSGPLAVVRVALPCTTRDEIESEVYRPVQVVS